MKRGNRRNNVGLLDILRRPATTAAELRTKLEALDQEAAEAAVAAAEATRREALLSGSDKDVDKAEAALTATRRELDRLVAAREELAARIPAAEIAERDAGLAAERAVIEAEAAAVEKLLADRWPKVVAEAVEMLKRLDAVERRRIAFSSKLAGLFGVQVPPVPDVPAFEHRLGFHKGDWWDGCSLRFNTILSDVGSTVKGWSARM